MPVPPQGYQDLDGAPTLAHAASHAAAGADALTLSASQIGSGTFADARISETSVTQHRAAILTLAAGQKFTGAATVPIIIDTPTGTTGLLQVATSTVASWTATDVTLAQDLLPATAGARALGSATLDFSILRVRTILPGSGGAAGLSIKSYAGTEVIRVDASAYLYLDASRIAAYTATPVVRPAAYTQTFSATTRTHAARTTATMTSVGASANAALVDVTGADTVDKAKVNANFDDCADQINKLQADLSSTASLLNQVLDDLQLIGWLQ